MSKVMFVMSGLDFGGAQRFCLNLTKYLSNIHYDYSVLFLRKGKSEEVRREFLNSGIHFYELGATSVTLALPRLIVVLRREKPQYFLSTVGNVDFVAAVARLFTPDSKLLIRKANVMFNNQRTPINRLKLCMEALLCTRMIALTESMKEDYLQYGFQNDRITVINNMVDTQYIIERCQEEHEAHPWFVEKSGPILIANARMVLEKRYDILIQAFSYLAKEIVNVRLMILGDGKLRAKIESMVPPQLRPRVEFLGFQSNPYYYMSHADAFVLTSDYEGFPNVVIEAMACGLPVVATDCKTGPREIIHSGREGFVVECGNARAVADAVKRILVTAQERERLSVNAVARAQDYSVEKIAAQYLNLFAQ